MSETALLAADASSDMLQDGARDSELHQARYRRLNLGMMASAGALLAVRAVHADLLTPVGAIWTVLQAGLTGMLCAAAAGLLHNKGGASVGQ